MKYMLLYAHCQGVGEEESSNKSGKPKLKNKIKMFLVLALICNALQHTVYNV